MKSLSPELISMASDEQLFELVGSVLDECLPNGRRASDDFVAEILALPVGLRAMAATYELDVSLSLDDLGWHFGNWHNRALTEETARGLEELEATELSQIFRHAYALALPFWSELGSESWAKWYNESSLDKALEPLNERAWAIQNSCKDGLFTYWLQYARRYPERCS